MPRRIASASRKPAVASSPVFAHLPVITALVVTVVPWTMRIVRASRVLRARPSPSASSASPRITASVGSSGVDSVLWIRSDPPATIR